MTSQGGTNGFAQQVRRIRAHISTMGITHIHLRKPWVPAFWSFSFPGLGYISMSRYIKGFMLVMWEILVNNLAHINQAIMETLLGRFGEAKAVLDVRYLLLYVPVYAYGIWDSYRSSVDMNKQYLLADREDGPLQPVVMDVVDINYLDQRHPWLALVWSLWMPGLGHLYTHKVITGFFVLIWWIAITWRSNLLVALQLSASGHFALATSVLVPQWLMYMPSIYCFAAYDAYSEAVEYNRLFQKEQARYLRATYQQPAFPLLAGVKRGS